MLVEQGVIDLGHGPKVPRFTGLDRDLMCTDSKLSLWYRWGMATPTFLN